MKYVKEINMLMKNWQIEGEIFCINMQKVLPFFLNSTICKNEQLKIQHEQLPNTSLEGRPFSATMELKTEMDSKQLSHEDDETG